MVALFAPDWICSCVSRFIRSRLAAARDRGTKRKPSRATVRWPRAAAEPVERRLLFASLAINDVAVTEGNSGTVNEVFTVSRLGSTAGSTTVNFTTNNSSAVSGSDYVANTGTLSFAAGDTSKTITVVVNGDTLQESNEVYTVNLSGASNATIQD